ncbi:2-hydroxychromene-2-carboxylate isomerase [Purpureocillium lavendulum]|uniref:Glutathione S-transferase kappa n=1 Tax=Purpureocillium lavendulum TaxID=1247861 RepID=A0AB34FPS3_9HYPO|nr:2-hydroxychromene-2-carboxylate isomerase [Purpureocillium lavendulum]
MAPNNKITLYVDTVSPFAYLAYYVLRHHAVFQGCDITYVPIFLGGLMKACGNTAPINITNKNVWINRNRQLWAETLHVPIKKELPSNFPPMTLGIMRQLAALDEADGRDKQRRLVQALDALYHEFWAEHGETHKPEVLRPLMEKVLGGEAAAAIAAEAARVGKAALQRNTDEAFAAGAFGLPWMVCTNAAGETESFWGVDHLGQVASFLGLKRPESGGWKALL